MFQRVTTCSYVRLCLATISILFYGPLAAGKAYFSVANSPTDRVLDEYLGTPDGGLGSYFLFPLKFRFSSE
jgi:hypothetical protein